MESLPEIPDFDVISCLGYGARSTIYAVSDKKTGQVYALKRVIRKSADDDRFVEQAETEYNIASQFDHPALRKAHRLIKRRKMLKLAELYLLMDLVDGQSLDVTRPPGLPSLLKVFTQVAQGLGAMHKLGYVHADIKPNNILVGEKLDVKIIDFGQSCSIGTIKQRIQGTPDYIAPEQVGRGPLTPATDVFNLGASLYWCVTDRHIPTLIPKKTKDGELPQMADRELVPPHELNPRCPAPLSRLIMECVQNRPSQRPRDMQSVNSRLELALSVARSDGENPSAGTGVTKNGGGPDSGGGLVSSIPAVPESKDDSADGVF